MDILAICPYVPLVTLWMSFECCTDKDNSNKDIVINLEEEKGVKVEVGEISCCSFKEIF